MEHKLKEALKKLYQERFDDSCKRVSEFLTKVGITTYNSDVSQKDTSTLLNEITVVLNKLESSNQIEELC